MSILEFYTNAPVLATILTLAYAALWAIFIYMLVKMYNKRFQ